MNFQDIEKRQVASITRERISKRDIKPLEIEFRLQAFYDATDNTYKFRDINGDAIFTIDPNTGTITFSTPVTFAGALNFSGAVTHSGAVTNNSTVTNNGAVVNNSSVVNNTTTSLVGNTTIYGTLLSAVKVLSLASFTADLTTGGTVTASSEIVGGEAVNAFDNVFTTKWVVSGDSTPWIKYQFASAKTIQRYTITTGEDAQDRDPRSWTFQGSNDDSNWTTIETRTDEWFGPRNITREFYCINAVAYAYYKLDFTANWGSVDFQIAEIQMMEKA